MTAQVLFFDVFSEKDPHLNAFEQNDAIGIVLVSLLLSLYIFHTLF